ncbi:hypothetical protein HMPREF9946_02510 [Acetobacteraceae bacterium AT-5844]|nr:hypothetical protein HMPREF9946_02510 [Acetobacteraceae bacterium AT-5844]
MLGRSSTPGRCRGRPPLARPARSGCDPLARPQPRVSTPWRHCGAAHGAFYRATERRPARS